jgi:hypothetical protein
MRVDNLVLYLISSPISSAVYTTLNKKPTDKVYFKAGMIEPVTLVEMNDLNCQ